MRINFLKISFSFQWFVLVPLVQLYILFSFVEHVLLQRNVVLFFTYKLGTLCSFLLVFYNLILLPTYAVFCNFFSQIYSAHTLMHVSSFTCLNVFLYIWDKVFKSGLSKFRGRQKIWKEADHILSNSRLSSIKFT